MKKRLFSMILISILCISTAACGNTSGGTASTNRTTITIAARDGSFSDVINAVKADFEESHNCSLNVLSFSADDIRNNTIEDSQKETGSYDIIMIDDPLMPEYIEKNILCNLTQLGYTDDEDFVEKSRLLGKDPYPLGATYALPFSGNVQLIFYNESVTGSDIDLTNWQSIYESCLEANKSGKKGYAIRGQSGNPIVSDFLPILWSYGGDIFEDHNVILDSQESRDALEFYCKLYSTGENYEKNDLVNAISSGEAGIALGWPSWFISGTGASAKIAQIPGKRDKNSEVLPTGEIGNWLMGITSNSSNKELALETIKYLTSKDVQVKALDYGGVPTRTSIFRDKAILDKYPFFEAIYSGTNNSRVRPRTAKWSSIEEVFGQELVKCINGEQSVDDTIRISQQKIEGLASQ
ncbi:MAG: extracellular solute-binding protein [Butyrivibrio sp.]|nr:extracellular solute-binding protein [Butyrivibrio sp.]